MAFTKTITALDVGTYKITCITGEVGSNGTVKINKVATVASQGMSGGMINDIAKAKKSITSCIDAIEKKQGFRVKDLHLTISGLQPNCHSVKETVKVGGKRVSNNDVNRLLKLCKSKVHDTDTPLLHATPLSYFVDGHPTDNPVGLIGKELSIKITLTTCDAYSIKNIKSLLEHCDINVKEIAFDGYMAAIGCLDKEEKDLFTAVINIGSETTSVSIMYKGKFVACSSFNISGDNITNDILSTTATSKMEAEQIKIKHAHAVLSNSIAIQNPIEFHRAGEKNTVPSTINTSTITEIVQRRLEEIFDKCKQAPYFANADRIILTGGSAKIENIAELCRLYLKKPSRIGTPNNVINLPSDYNNSMYTTTVGLLRHSGLNRPTEESELVDKETLQEGSLITRLINWVKTEL
ncbi:MAG: cell division protein FtsA [Alphaproteobacteria bacterium]